MGVWTMFAMQYTAQGASSAWHYMPRPLMRWVIWELVSSIWAGFSLPNFAHQSLMYFIFSLLVHHNINTIWISVHWHMACHNVTLLTVFTFVCRLVEEEEISGEVKAEFKEKTKVLKNGLFCCLFVCLFACFIRHTIMEVTNDIIEKCRSGKET